jgi:hypothetical protein
MERKPCATISSPANSRRRSAALSVLSLVGRSFERIEGNTSRPAHGITLANQHRMPLQAVDIFALPLPWACRRGQRRREALDTLLTPCDWQVVDSTGGPCRVVWRYVIDPTGIFQSCQGQVDGSNPLARSIFPCPKAHMVHPQAPSGRHEARVAPSRDQKNPGEASQCLTL